MQTFSSNVQISTTRSALPTEQLFEVVERKGIGHPDTLADAIAEKISQSYSQYCLNHFGVVPNHWIDKCTLIGGECERGFGWGKVITPIQVHVIGKVTQSIGDEKIPVYELCEQVIWDYLQEVFPHILKSDYKVSLFINRAHGAGRPMSWYAPLSIKDIKTVEQATANDAVICAAYAPLSPIEALTLLLEKKLNGKSFKASYPYIGTDIKVIALRKDSAVHLTLCIPFIASLTPSREFYDQKKDEMRALILEFAKKQFPQYQYTVHVNTRDDEHVVYMTHLGSALDTGDVGVVGRGNRLNGLITPNRPQSIEAPCGKNPVYHTGKIYSVLAQVLSNEIYQEFKEPVEVYITSETGTPLKDPACVMVTFHHEIQTDLEKQRLLSSIIEKQLNSIPDLTHQLIQGKIDLF